MMQIRGHDWFAKNLGATVVHEDNTGKLWQKDLKNEVWKAIEVINGSPEPDGSFKHYWIRVPPEIKTAMEGVAWTYGLSTKQYKNLQIRT